MSFVRVIKFAAAAVLFAAAITPVMAADSGGKYAVRGVGSARCDLVTAAFSTKNAAQSEAYASWIMGYVTAYNKVVAGNFDALPTKDGRDLISLVLGLCQSNATAPLEATTFRVIRAIAALRLTSDTSPVTFTSDGKTAELRQETVKYVQARLKALKFYSGAETGEATPQLIAAIKTYQTNKKIPITGLPDIALLIRLSQKQ